MLRAIGGMKERLAELVVGIMQAFEIPISLVPGWYPNVTAERHCYRPFYEPWRADLVFRQAWRKELSTCGSKTAYLLFSLAMMASGREGEFWECGVYRGGTAKLLARARAVPGTPVSNTGRLGFSIPSPGCRKKIQKPTPTGSARWETLRWTRLDCIWTEKSGRILPWVHP